MQLIPFHRTDDNDGQLYEEQLDPYLEKRLRIRPAGVVSKKIMGDRKMAKAIRS